MYPGRAKLTGVNKREVQLCKTAPLLSLANKGHFTSYYFPSELEADEAQAGCAESNNSSMAQRNKKDKREPLVTICIESTAQQK